ncbi:hypothetical protein BBW65_04465 [Helicobacter enhydrae]|uniref:Probable membrane transporter protein n=1 Tax=Helicobacter enhydrae TaxID=222136 RepID=A0A1B1U5R4_9HELI|nr:sulfite exporter TauE/SafE family protein [Helicobacter enhydrae]ANV98099.1 hypothetical protein BBW65_04465 [Helicobacter enhydrae]
MFLVWIALGIVSGIGSGLFGIGGGTIILPTLMLMGYDIQYAIGISMVQMIFASFVGSYINYKKGLIPLRNGIILGFGGMIGSSLSGPIVQFLGSLWLNIAFLCCTFISFYKYFFTQPKHTSTARVSQPTQLLILWLAGILTGMFSSSLGIGGGLILVPILGYFLGLDSKKAVPLSLFFIALSSISGALSLYHSGFVHLQTGIIIGLCSAIGVLLGLTIASRITSKTHKTLLLFVYLFAIISTSFKLF